MLGKRLCIHTELLFTESSIILHLQALSFCPPCRTPISQVQLHLHFLSAFIPTHLPSHLDLGAAILSHLIKSWETAAATSFTSDGNEMTWTPLFSVIKFSIAETSCLVLALRAGFHHTHSERGSMHWFKAERAQIQMEKKRLFFLLSCFK